MMIVYLVELRVLESGRLRMELVSDAPTAPAKVGIFSTREAAEAAGEEALARLDLDLEVVITEWDLDKRGKLP